MRYSKFFIPTLKEVPADAQVISHILMFRAGMIRKLSAGVYNYLPLGLRTLKKIENIVREEMVRAGAVELLMPFVQPSEIWVESGRWNYYGPELLRFKDRKGADFCLGPTHEEVITDLVRNEIRSYRDVPINLFQIQTKFRDEVRPRFGLMRGREFLMKDAYSFDLDEKGAHEAYKIMYAAYQKIFKRCGLRFKAVEAGTGAIGGTLSHEFQVLAKSGEDAILSCSKCDYAANIEKAECANVPLDAVSEVPAGAPMPQEVSTPDKKTVEEVTAFLNVGADHLIKTLLYLADGKTIAVLVRGDHELGEAKLSTVLKCDLLELADDETVTKVTGAKVGFAGPLSLPSGLPVYADFAVAHVADGVVGANKSDAHLVHVFAKRDLPKKISYHDLRVAKEGEKCPRCSEGAYEAHRGIEVGQVFYLGKKYSERMGAYVNGENGEKITLDMGCYGIGVSRTMAAAIEQNNDENGIIWPFAIAPFHVMICPVGNDKEIVTAAFELYEEMVKAGVEVLIDDRMERPGVMFKDADLLGIPLRITVGKKGLKENKAELKLRREKEPYFIARGSVIAHVKELITNETAVKV